MSRKSMVWLLKALVLGALPVLALFYGSLFPDTIAGFGLADPGYAHLVLPMTVMVSLSLLPILASLFLFWQICTDIGRDRSFTRANARRMARIALCALADTLWVVIGLVALVLCHAGHPGVVLAGFVLLLAGGGITLAALLLSHLIGKAAALQEENDLTV